MPYRRIDSGYPTNEPRIFRFETIDLPQTLDLSGQGGTWDLPRHTEYSGKNLSVTISIGYAERENGSRLLPEAVIKAADKALYRAKQQGRNCLSL